VAKQKPTTAAMISRMSMKCISPLVPVPVPFRDLPQDFGSKKKKKEVWKEDQGGEERDLQNGRDKDRKKKEKEEKTQDEKNNTKNACKNLSSPSSQLSLPTHLQVYPFADSIFCADSNDTSYSIVCIQGRVLPLRIRVCFFFVLFLCDPDIHSPGIQCRVELQKAMKYDPNWPLAIQFLMSTIIVPLFSGDGKLAPKPCFQLPVLSSL